MVLILLALLNGRLVPQTLPLQALLYHTFTLNCEENNTTNQQTTEHYRAANHRIEGPAPLAAVHQIAFLEGTALHCAA